MSDIERYDAGLLGDYGGGNVGWWQDYIRVELNRAHEFYDSQIAVVEARCKELEKALRTIISKYDAADFTTLYGYDRPLDDEIEAARYLTTIKPEPEKCDVDGGS